jgi:putative hydrolase of the HAD superfamily
MSNNSILLLNSASLLAELQDTYAIHSREESGDGYVVYQTEEFQIRYYSHNQNGFSPDVNGGGNDYRCYVIDENYENLRGWADTPYKTIWVNWDNNLPPCKLPSHDFELNGLDQLEKVFEDGRIPALSQCLAWWNEWDLPENVRRHVTTVAWAAYTLAIMLRAKGIEADPVLTHRGGLLHDLDKIRTLKMVTGHGKVSGSFLAEKGYDEVAEIVREHIMHTILDPTADDRPWEVKLVYFCDKLAEGDRIVTLDERFTALGERYPAYMQKMSEAKIHVWGLNNEICALLDIHDNDHLVSLLNTILEKVS